MDTSPATRPVGVDRNGLPTNTSIATDAALVTRQARASSTSPQLHGLEDDHELYERVIQRVRRSGETVRAEDILGPLDDCVVGQPEAD